MEGLEHFTSDPKFSEQQQQQLEQMIEELRQIIELSVRTNTGMENLVRLTERFAELKTLLADCQGERRPRPVYDPEPYDLNGITPYSPIAGRLNPMAPKINIYADETQQKIIGEVEFGSAHEGPPHCVHGGVVSLVWDQVLAMVPCLLDTNGPTAYLNVNYRVGTPINQPLRYEAWLDRQEGKKIFAKGACYAGDVLTTEAEALFIDAFINKSAP